MAPASHPQPHLFISPCPSTCAPVLQLRPARRSLTFEVLGVAPWRSARVSSGQRGDTGEVVAHGIRPQGVQRSQGPGEAGQERRYSASVCARTGARRRGRALVRLRPGAGGLLFSSLSSGSAVFGGSCPPRGSSSEPATCLPLPATGVGATWGPLGWGQRLPELPAFSSWRLGSGWWWAAQWLPRALLGP